MRALKESWKEAPQAIEELEKEGEVLVTRTVKDGQLRMVFWNEIKPTEEEGGMLVEKGTLCTFCVIGRTGFLLEDEEKRCFRIDYFVRSMHI